MQWFIELIQGYVIMLMLTKKLNRTPVSLSLAIRSLLTGCERRLSIFLEEQLLLIYSSFTVLTLMSTLRNYCYPAIIFIFPGWQ